MVGTSGDSVIGPGLVYLKVARERVKHAYEGHLRRRPLGHPILSDSIRTCGTSAVKYRCACRATDSNIGIYNEVPRIGQGQHKALDQLDRELARMDRLLDVVVFDVWDGPNVPGILSQGIAGILDDPLQREAKSRVTTRFGPSSRKAARRPLPDCGAFARAAYNSPHLAIERNSWLQRQCPATRRQPYIVSVYGFAVSCESPFKSLLCQAKTLAYSRKLQSSARPLFLKVGRKSCREKRSRLTSFDTMEKRETLGSVNKMSLNLSKPG
jgi:hypothetical protein